MKNKRFLTENKQKTAENSGKQVRKASQKQAEHTDKQSLKHNFFKTSNANTSIYNKKRKRERKNIFLLQKKKKKKKKRRKIS